MSDINMGDWANTNDEWEQARLQAFDGEVEPLAEVVELNAPLAEARDTDGQPGDNLYLLVDEDGNVLDALRRDVAWGIELQDGQRIVESIDYTTVAFDED